MRRSPGSRRRLAALHRLCKNLCVTTTPAHRYEHARVDEQKAWALVQDHLPGTPGHNPELWELWQETVRAAEAAKRDMQAPGHRSGAGSESLLEHLGRDAGFKPTGGGPGS